MEYLDNCWKEYSGADNSQNIVGGYTCPTCQEWVPYSGNIHYCWHYPTLNYYPIENKTEKAFKILKLLVKEQIIKEPTSFKKFCDLIEKITKTI